MNWQIPAGIILAGVIFLVMTIFLKRYRVILITVLVLLMLESAFLYSAYRYVSQSDEPKETIADVSLQQEDCLNLFYELLAAGDYPDAEAVLNDVMSYGGYDSDYLLAAARLYAMEGNTQGAKSLYNNLLEQGRLTADKGLAEECEKGGNLSDEGSLVKLNKIILDSLEEKNSGSPYKEVADAISSTSQLVLSVKRGEVDKAKVKEKAADICDLYEKEEKLIPQVFLISAVEESVMSAELMAGEYDRIAEMVGKNCTTDQILILSELFRQNKISDNTFQRSSGLREQVETAESNLNWIKNQKENSGYQKDDRDFINNAIDELHLMTENPKAAYAEWVKGSIREKAGNDDEGGKLYLQLSRIAYDEGNEELSQAYLRESFSASRGSEDPAFSGPVNEIKDILENQNNPEELKKLQALSTMVVDNMGPGILQDLGVASSEDNTGYSQIVAEQISGGDIFFEESESQSEKEEADIPQSTTETTVIQPKNIGKKQGSYTQFVSNQVNQMSASVSIASIDASAFEEVTAVIALDKSMAYEPDDFRNNINILDCGIVIPDYEVEKLADAKVNIVLCCDTSGSMAGQKIADLQDALREFSGKAGSDTNIGIVSFSSGVNDAWTSQPKRDRSDLNVIINSLSADGGTSILSGVEYGLGMFTDKTALNIMVVMSDGQDSMPSDETLLRIQTECEDQNIQIYTMGLGADVDADVLSSYSDYGGGSNMFVSDSSSLYDFYDYAYKVSQNRFKITYNALDTINTSRELLAEYKNSKNIRDTKTYSLYEDTGVGSNSLDRLTNRKVPDYQATLENVILSGLDTRLLYRSSVPQTINLVGNNLSKDRDISVSLHAGLEYNLKTEYVNDNTWKVIVPARAACGDYDVYVEVNGKRAIFDSGLVIADNNMHTVTFGDYVFSATGIQMFDNGNEIKLTGYITMNNWLGFKKEVLLTGNTDQAQEISVSWNKGYIDYHLSDNVQGHAKYLAENKKSLSLPGVDGLKLYRDDFLNAASEEFRVDHYEVYGSIIPDMILIPTANMSLYPDRAEFTFIDFALQMPFMDKLFGIKGRDEIFDFDLNMEAKLIVDGEKLGTDISAKYSSKDTKMLRSLKFGNIDLKVNLGTFDLGINTFTGEGHFELVTTIFKLWNDNGFRVEWNTGYLDAVLLKMDKDITNVYGGIPVTFSNFSVGISGLSKMMREVNFSDLELIGGLNISVNKVKAVAPGLEKFVGDVSFFSFDDIEARLRLTGLKATSNASVFGFNIGSGEIQIGAKIPYTNMLLGIEDVEGAGFDVKLSPQIKVEFLKSYVEANAYCRVSALWNKVLGISVGGDIKAAFRIWVITKDYEGRGDIFIGGYQQHNQKFAWGIIVSANGQTVVNAVWNSSAQMNSIQV